jgi:hypothetical protein
MTRSRRHHSLGSAVLWGVIASAAAVVVAALLSYASVIVSGCPWINITDDCTIQHPAVVDGLSWAAYLTAGVLSPLLLIGVPFWLLRPDDLMGL